MIHHDLDWGARVNKFVQSMQRAARMRHSADRFQAADNVIVFKGHRR